MLECTKLAEFMESLNNFSNLGTMAYVGHTYPPLK